MIIKSFEIEKLKSIDSSFHLIYGNNDGIKEDIINNFYIKDFKGETLKYDENEVLNNIDEFKISLFNKSLFQNDKLIIISRATDKLIDFINDIIEKELSDIKIIIKSSVLEKKSKLRTLFEKEKKTVCIPVYSDESRALSSLVYNFIKESNLKLSQEIINILIERSRGDRIFLKNELVKLKNLSFTKKKISIEDIKKLSNLAENYSVFELSDHYLARNSKKVSNILNENNYSSEDCILIIRTLLSKAKRLLKIRTEIDNNKNIDQVISRFKPPIFWKEKNIVKKQAQSWSTSEVKEIIIKINNLEALIKKNVANSTLFVSDFVSNF